MVALIKFMVSKFVPGYQAPQPYTNLLCMKTNFLKVSSWSDHLVETISSKPESIFPKIDRSQKISHKGAITLFQLFLLYLLFLFIAQQNMDTSIYEMNFII